VILFLNIALGLIPTLILGGSIAAGVDDDRAHRRMFIFVYGLWAVTLAMWNWMRSAPLGWILLWLIAGVSALGTSIALRSPRR
jgi:hypothetical protein